MSFERVVSALQRLNIFRPSSLPLEKQDVESPDGPSPTATHPADEVTYPEGGRAANVVLAGSFCAITGGLGLMNSIGVYQAWIAADQLRDADHGAVGWIFGLFNFMVFFCGVQIGPVFDALGPAWLMALSWLLYLAFFVALGFCRLYWHFAVVVGLVAGAATSVVFVVPVAALGHFFRRRRGAATGLAMSGGSLGGVVFPLVFEYLGPRLGFAWTTRVVGLISLVLVAVGCVAIRSRPELRPRAPRKADLLPDFFIFRNPAVATMTAGVFFIEWGFFVGLEYIASYALADGISRRMAFLLIVFLNAASFPGRWLPGLLADKLGRLRTLLWTNVLCTVAMLAIWLPAQDNLAAIIIFSVTFGFASGSNISLVPVCVGELCDTSAYGRYYTTVYTIVSLGALTGVPIAAAIVSRDNGAYTGLIIFAGASYAVGVACFVATGLLRKKRA